MPFFKEPLWSADYPRSRFASPIVARMADWPLSYLDVENAMGGELADHRNLVKKQPVPWRHGLGDVDHKGAVLILMCELLRLREAAMRCGASKAYLLRTSIPMGDDHVQAFVETEIEPTSLLQKIVGSLKSSKPKPPHREHPLAFDYQWLDDGLYFLDKELGRDRHEKITIDMAQPWAEQMGILFGPGYQSLVEQSQLQQITKTATSHSPRRRGL